MSTIIRQFAAPASFPRSLMLDIEPEISLPASVLGAYRLRRSLEFSAKIRAGTWPSLAEVDTAPAVEFGSNYAHHAVGGRSLGVQGQPLPAGSLTFAVVNYVKRFDAAGDIQFLAGSGTSSANATGIIRSNGSLNLGLQVNGSVAPGSIPPPATERWELVFGRIDVSNPASLKGAIYLPRAGLLSETAIVPPAPTAAATRVLGSAFASAAVRNAWVAVFGAALSKAEMDSIYASAKNSLQVTGINI